MQASGAVLAVSICVLVWGADARAQQAVISGPRVPVEYTNVPDEMSAGCVHNGADPHQVLYTEPLDAAGCPLIWDTFDFDVTEHVAADVDALANCQDGYFAELIAWPASVVDMLVSFEGDLPDPPGSAVYYEKQTGVTGFLWEQANLCNAGGGFDGGVDDVDGLELWGDLDVDDANMFSLVGDPGGTSVWSYLGGPPVPVPYISQATIFVAVQSLGFAGVAAEVDVDALMVWDEFCDGMWGVAGGDTVVFSIRAAANWDGGEIVVLNPAGGASFLNHGGHLWDTAFPVAATLGGDTEEVDAIEAAFVDALPREVDIPTLSEWGLVVLVLMLIAAGMFFTVRRPYPARRSI